jgi:hypothetical protein
VGQQMGQSGWKSVEPGWASSQGFGPTQIWNKKNFLLNF